MNKKNVMSFLLAGLLLVLLVSGCGGTKSAEKAESSKEPMKVRIGFTSWPTNMLVYVAQEKGIFQKNGLEVSLKEFPSTTESSNAFLSGNLDMCTYPAPDTIPPVSEGAKFKVIMMTDKSLGSDGLVSKPEIQSIKDLKGKTIATQLYSVDHMYLLTLLDNSGMSAADVKIVDMSMADAGNAFLAGKVDAASIWEPYLGKAVNGGGKLLYSTKDNPDLITDCIAASADMIKEHPESVTAFVKSWNETVLYWQNNRDEAEAIMAKKMNVSPKECHEMMDTLVITTAKDSVVGFTKADKATYWGYTQQKIASFLKDLKVIKKDVDAATIIDDTFVKKVVNE
ncbi:MAG: aliphatic sulfonate transporter substrate-binding protein [Firmicutes bacterium]|nr:aliphatic sulfonate transporter substrate-binding protein [Bacillota bacterium]